jgi:D-arabinose 1-dehydrogenase-like Zn-dependent alcohol dehydrogenase
MPLPAHFILNHTAMAITYTTFKGSESGQIHEEKITRDDLKSDEVLVQIEYSGVCGTDEHMRHGNMSLGHEGVGVVKDTGKDVTQLKTYVSPVC